MMKTSPIHNIPVGDISIACRTYGPEQKMAAPQLPLVMITGYGGLMELWPDALIRPLAQSRRVIVFDNRGLGFTTSSDLDYSIALFAEDTRALLDALDINRSHILGWSMGTFIAQELALRHPRMMDRLILMAGSCGGQEALWPEESVWSKLTDLSGTLEERIQRMFSNLFRADWLRENPDPSAYFPPVTAPVDDGNLLRQARALRDWPGSWSRLPQLTAQTLILTGLSDQVMPPGNADLMAARLPNATRHSVPEGGHGFFFQFPELTARTITAFLGDD